jgi:hypothetical protein
MRGGFNDESWQLITKICRFDYMGSAEFEFGAVPESLAELYKVVRKKKYSVGVIPSIKDIYYICKTEHEGYVKETITSLASEDYPKKVPTKEGVWLKQAMEGKKYYEDLAGWLEVDNAFMFFIDKEMFNDFKEIFGIKEAKK